MRKTQFLHQIPIGRLARIVVVHSSEKMPDCARQLGELGFLPDEHIVVLRRTMPGADPLVVRIGVSTFALRQAEAACVEVLETSVGNGSDMSDRKVVSSHA